MYTPSERTVENLSNHGFLEVLNTGKAGPPFAWFCLPTQVEEAFLGYDADLAGSKRLYIQYKRMSSPGMPRFDFSFRQLWAMGAHLPKGKKAYVLLSGNTVQTYFDLAALHNPPVGTRYAAFDHTFFVDAWEVIEAACTAVLGTPAAGLPPLLPLPPPAAKDLGFVALEGNPGAGPFSMNLNRSSKIHNGVLDLLTACGLAPAAPQLLAPLPLPLSYINVLGFGRAFAEATGKCHYGRPVDEFLSPDAADSPERRRIATVGEDSRRELRRLTLLAVPMP